MDKIAIIGGGWVGCHLARVLSLDADVSLYERNSFLLNETSAINQNRLHYGYHYARNGSTRELCKTTFQLFLRDYGHITKNVPNNFYAVSNDESLLDDATILSIFRDFPHQKVSYHPLQNTSLVLNTPERFIDTDAARDYFEQLLWPLLVDAEVSVDDVDLLKQDYDFVIDCTNNSLLRPADNCFFENVMMMLYTIKKPLPFGALTYIDGELFSLYPYLGGRMSLSHVVHGILSQHASYPSKLYAHNYDQHRMAMEQHIKQYWPEFDDYLEPEFPVSSIKAKVKNKSASRMPVAKHEDNLISVFTGKIQGIYTIENIVKDFIAQA